MVFCAKTGNLTMGTVPRAVPIFQSFFKRRSKMVNAGQGWSTPVNAGQRRSMPVKDGQHRSMPVKDGQHRSTPVDEFWKIAFSIYFRCSGHVYNLGFARWNF
ncbi:hypothetical protein TIFTF001_042378 [Ficus carica]|uniref:Uncharacterized protein n=1 Tax=Ficus carica TaxID=3494 RepID=A0AA88CZ08_FICCA|nr:hypothetical protein TIFTF001_042378 [Ficus carica]